MTANEKLLRRKRRKENKRQRKLDRELNVEVIKKRAKHEKEKAEAIIKSFKSNPKYKDFLDTIKNK